MFEVLIRLSIIYFNAYAYIIDSVIDNQYKVATYRMFVRRIIKKPKTFKPLSGPKTIYCKTFFLIIRKINFYANNMYSYLTFMMLFMGTYFNLLLI